ADLGGHRGRGGAGVLVEDAVGDRARGGDGPGEGRGVEDGGAPGGGGGGQGGGDAGRGLVDDQHLAAGRGGGDPVVVDVAAVDGLPVVGARGVEGDVGRVGDGAVGVDRHRCGLAADLGGGGRGGAGALVEDAVGDRARGGDGPGEGRGVVDGAAHGDRGGRQGGGHRGAGLADGDGL